MLQLFVFHISCIKSKRWIYSKIRCCVVHDSVHLSFLPMALFCTQYPYSVLVLLFFLIPSICFPLPYCPGIHLPCGTNINISYPFYTNNSPPGCNTTYLIQCIESKPTIQFQDYSNDTAVYTVKTISYSHKTITLVHPDFTIFHPDSDCSFLYNFTYPVPHFDRPHRPIIDGLDRSISSCTWQKEDFSLLSDNYNYSICKNFSFYNWNESEKVMPKGASSACHAPVPPLFELKLSFDELDDDGLSLLSAGFSHSLELSPDCFDDTLCTNSCHSCTNSGITLTLATEHKHFCLAQHHRNNRKPRASEKCCDMNTAEA